MTEPKKIRVCDLKPGDRVIINGLEREVYKLNGSVYFKTLGQFQTHYNEFKKGVRSQEWVELIESSPIENTYTQ
jgi:hypothetical protein